MQNLRQAPPPAPKPAATGTTDILIQQIQRKNKEMADRRHQILSEADMRDAKVFAVALGLQHTNLSQIVKHNKSINIQVSNPNFEKNKIIMSNV